MWISLLMNNLRAEKNIKKPWSYTLYTPAAALYHGYFFSNVELNNFDFIEKLDFRLGCALSLLRSLRV